MNMKKIILLSTISLGLINSLQAQYTSKVVMKQGQLITAEVSMNMTATQTMQDQPMEMKTDAVSVQTFKIIAVSENGYTLLSTLTKMKLNFDGFGQKQEYDSENKEKQSGMLAGPLNEKINKSDTIQIDLTGALIEKSESEKKDKKKGGRGMGMMFGSNETANLETAFLIIPSDKKLGEKWRITKEKDGIKNIIEYTIESIEGNVVHLSAKQQVKGTKVGEGQGGMQFTTTMNNLSEATLTVDKTTGLVLSKTDTTRTDSKMQMMDKEIPSTSVVHTTTVYK